MRLRTFGGLWIDPGPGASEVSPGPRLLALPAVVAAAGRAGITRERAIGILWSEIDEDLARHRLSQTLYLLRRETGARWVEGTTRLCLERADSSDVTEFYEAIEAGQLERAAALYTGPFLDGFYLHEAPDFDLWADETRARLHASVLKAIGILGRRASDAGAHEDAVVWWGRLCSLDPYNGSFAIEQIRSHVALGETALATRLARAYESRVRHELETELDPSIARRIGELLAAPAPPRGPAHAESVGDAARPESVPPSGVRPFGEASPGGDAPDGGAASAGESPEPVAMRSRYRRQVAFGVSMVAALAVVAAWLGPRLSRPAGPDLLAIGSLASPDLAGSGSVLRDMLATNLGRVGGLRVVANSRLVELLGPNDSPTVRATADAARRAGAREIIEGELQGAEGALVLSLRRVALGTGVVLQGYTVRAADLYGLTDSATAAIAADFGLDPPADPVAGVRTGSAVAYALYEQGLRAYYHGDLPAAIRLMSAALERDSTFAMAAAYLWRSNWEAARLDDAAALIPLVRRLASRTNERERISIETMLAWAGAPLQEFLGLARDLTARFPEDPDGQVLLGHALVAAGEWAGAVAAYDRAVAIDSISGATGGTFCRVCRALHEMSAAWMWWDSLPSAERSVRRLIALRPGDEIGWTDLVESLLRQGRQPDAEAAMARATQLSQRPIDFRFYLDRDLIRTGRLEELEDRLVSELRTATPEARGQMPWLLALTLRNQGRLLEATRLGEDGTVPGSPVRLDGYVDVVTLAIVSLEEGRPAEAASRFLDMAAATRVRTEQPGHRARNLSWYMTLAGTALAAAGDTVAVLALADSVESIGKQSSFGRDYRLPEFLRGLVHQRGARHVEAVEAFRRSLFSLTDGYTRINLELARSLVELGRYDEAIAVLQPALRGGVDGGNTYVTHTELHEALAGAFEAAGRPDSAMVHWTAVEQAWRGADPAFADRYRYAARRSTSTGEGP